MQIHDAGIAAITLGDVVVFRSNDDGMDHAQAAAWYRKSAAPGDAAAQKNWAGCIPLDEGCRKTRRRLLSGIARQVMQRRNTCWAGTMRQAKVCHKTSRKPISGWILLLLVTSLEWTPKIGPKLREKVAKTRDLIASLLISSDRSHVQERARKWLEDHSARRSDLNPPSVRPSVRAS